MPRRRISGVLFVALGAGLWGTDSVLRSSLTERLSPIQVVFYEHLIMVAVAIPLIWSARFAVSKMSRAAWAAILGTAIVGSALSTVLFTYAIHSGNPTTAVLLQQIQPLIALSFARLMLRERLNRGFGLSAALAVCGTYVMVFGSSILAPWHSLEWLPGMFAAGAAIGWGATTVWGRMAALEIPTQAIASLRVICALPALFIAVLVEGTVSAPRLHDVPSLLWLGLVPGFAALMIYYYGLRSATASQSTIAELAFPATASLLNWSVLGVPASWTQVVGFAVVWSAILNLTRSPSQAES